MWATVWRMSLLITFTLFILLSNTSTFWPMVATDWRMPVTKSWEHYDADEPSASTLAVSLISSLLISYGKPLVSSWTRQINSIKCSSLQNILCISQIHYFNNVINLCFMRWPGSGRASIINIHSIRNMFMRQWQQTFLSCGSLMMCKNCTILQGSLWSTVLIMENIHSNLVIMLILGAKQNERRNEMHLLNGIKCIVVDWKITWDNHK